MTIIWESLFAAFSVVACFAVVWSLTEQWVSPLPTWARTTFFGALLGATTVAAMSLASELMPGFTFDMRHALIASSGFFGGPISAAITAGMAAVYRAELGGGGAQAGILGIAISGCLGTIAHFVIRKRTNGPLASTLFSAIVGASVPLSLFILPADVRQTIWDQVGLPLIGFTAVGTLFTVALIEMEFRRREATRANKIYRAMVEELPDALFAKDAEGRFIAANAATVELLGVKSLKDVINRTVFDILPAERAVEKMQFDRSVMTENKASSVEHEVPNGAGRASWLSTTKAPLRNAAGEAIGTVTYSRDITALHEMNAKKDDFVSTVSHELRSPVTAIRGALQLIASGAAGELPPKAEKLFMAANRSVARLAELIDDILDLEKITSDKMDFDPEAVPIGEATRDALDMIAYYMPEKRINWVTQGYEAEVSAYVNPKRLHQILTNLLTNAVKFSPEGSDAFVEITATSDHVQICVRDQGPGVPSDFEEHLFKRYSQEKMMSSKKGTAGTGLGLSIVKEMANRMGGEIEYGRRNDMTEFTVSLPIANGMTNENVAA